MPHAIDIIQCAAVVHHFLWVVYHTPWVGGWVRRTFRRQPEQNPAPAAGPPPPDPATSLAEIREDQGEIVENLRRVEGRLAEILNHLRGPSSAMPSQQEGAGDVLSVKLFSRGKTEAVTLFWTGELAAPQDDRLSLAQRPGLHGAIDYHSPLRRPNTRD